MSKRDVLFAGGSNHTVCPWPFRWNTELALLGREREVARPDHARNESHKGVGITTSPCPSPYERVVAAPFRVADTVPLRDWDDACAAAARAGEDGGETAEVEGRASTTDLGLQALPTTKVNTFSVLFC